MVLGLTYSGTVLTNLVLPSAFTYVSHIFTPSNLVTWTTHIFSTIVKFLDKIYTYGNKKDYVSVYFRTYTSLGLLSYRCWPRPPDRARACSRARRDTPTATAKAPLDDARRALFLDASFVQGYE